jgi:hypothetical protein
MSEPNDGITLGIDDQPVGTVSNEPPQPVEVKGDGSLDDIPTQDAPADDDDDSDEVGDDEDGEVGDLDTLPAEDDTDHDADADADTGSADDPGVAEPDDPFGVDVPAGTEAD